MSSIKVTALLPDILINEVKEFAKRKQANTKDSQKITLTDSLSIALKDWVKLQKTKKLIEQTQGSPLSFSDNFSAESVRTLNR